MRRVYAIGETVLDIIFKEGKVQDAKPGGAMLNSSVSLGRAGTEITFISEFANDPVGLMVDAFLKENNVDTSNIYRHPDGKTSIAMAFLDKKSDASYVFYKNHPQQRLQIEVPNFSSNDILLFGSFFGIDPKVREVLLKMVAAAKNQGALIVYDPNFRKPHAHELEVLRPVIMENIRMADIVRGSHEDFQIILNVTTIEEVRRAIGTHPPVLIMTQSSTGVFLDAPNIQRRFPVKPIQPVSTIGAGDNFNAGLIYGLLQTNVFANQLSQRSPTDWEKITNYGVNFASDVCMNLENYISIPFAKSL